MFARWNRARPILAAWLVAGILVLTTVAAALAGDGGGPYSH